NNMEGLLSHVKASDDLEEIKLLTVPLVESVIRLKETINELSDITRIEQEIEVAEKVNLVRLLEEVKASIRDSLVASNANISVDFEDDEINFSKKNLRSIFFNLLSNALKYRSPDRQLEVLIKSRSLDNAIIISFEDNGIGIKKDKVREIFAKFTRVHDKKVAAEGVGIGLYLVKKIIENSGGEIEVESQFGKGSCFTIYINKKTSMAGDLERRV